MNSFVKCIHCGRDFKLNDALAHELAEETEKIKKSVEEEVFGCEIGHCGSLVG